MVNKSLDQNRLKQLFDYSLVTGKFYHKKKTSRKNIGQLAGSINGDGRRYISIDGERYRASRLAWLYINGEWPKYVIDHINRDPSFDGFMNLGDVPQLVNGKNCKKSINNTSGYNGVTWDAKNNKWQAAITVSGCSIKLGRFEKCQDAVDAREKAEKEFGFHPQHGRFL